MALELRAGGELEQRARLLLDGVPPVGEVRRDGAGHLDGAVLLLRVERADALAMRWAAPSAPADDSGSSASSKRSSRSSSPSPPSGSTTSTARCTTWLRVTGSGSVGMRWCLPLPARDRARQLVLGHGRAPRDVELLRALVQLLLGEPPVRLLTRALGETAQGLGDRLLL